MRNRKKIPYIEFFCGMWYDNRAKAAMIDGFYKGAFL